MKYKLRGYKNLTSPKDVAALVKLIDKYGLQVIKCGRGQKYPSFNIAYASNEFVSFAKCIIIEEKETRLEITTKYFSNNNKTCTYIFSLNDQNVAAISGQKAFAEMCKAYKVPDFRENSSLKTQLDTETGKFMCSASPLIDYNRKYNKTRLLNVYEYDLNSAYTSAMINKIPDTSSYRLKSTIKKDEIGFIIDKSLTLITTKGSYADIIFPLIETPSSLKQWLLHIYDRKKTSTGNEKAKAKAYLNYPIGYCQRVNPFLRAYIVHTCNRTIENLIDEDTLFWNTDAIFSIRKRDDLDVGDNIGQFKEVKIDSLYYNGNNYQVGLEEPVYRGIPKQWFKSFAKVNKRPFDMAIDGIPPKMNIYAWDWDKLEIKEIDYEEKIQK